MDIKEQLEQIKNNAMEMLKNNEDLESIRVKFLGKKGELTAVLREIIAQVGAAGPQDMGKVMGVATKQLAGKAEGKAINQKVRELLAQ